jgi:hypothetical protein
MRQWSRRRYSDLKITPKVARDAPFTLSTIMEWKAKDRHRVLATRQVARATPGDPGMGPVAPARRAVGRHRTRAEPR